MRRELRRTLLALVGTAAGAQLVVAGAEGIAIETELSGGFVGLAVVALGTSLPELVTAVQAARREEPDLIVGNVLGSNVFNSLLAGGLIAVIAPGRLPDSSLTGLATITMVGAAPDLAVPRDRPAADAARGRAPPERLHRAAAAARAMSVDAACGGRERITAS